MAYERTLIIGNGFDLDLGYQTRYSDFAASDKWPINDSFLLQFLNSRKSDSWFDLENSLAEYATGESPLLDLSTNDVHYYDEWGKDLDAFSDLRLALANYINDEQSNREINKCSDAAVFFKEVISQGYFQNIFSYNYTDLSMVSQALGCKIPEHVKHVHGTCKDNSAIIGVSDDLFGSVKQEYTRFYKTSSPSYHSSNVRFALQQSNIVVFWGHSLGRQDYHYFKNFFQEQTKEDITSKDKKKIIFFTYDGGSQFEITNQLREMNQGRVNLLYDCNDLKFILTSRTNKKQLYDFITSCRNSMGRRFVTTL